MWTCDCQVAEVLTWLTRKRRDLGLTRELPPIKCFDHGEYRTLWTAAKAEEGCTILQVKITATDLSISSTSRKQLQTTSQLENTIVDESRVTESGIQIDDILEEKESETTAKESGQYELGNKLRRKRTTKDPEQGTPIAEILHPRRESATERYRNSLWNEITRNSNLNLVFVVFPVAIGIFITMSLISVKVFTIWLNARYDFSVYKADEASSTYSEIYLPSSSICNSLKDHNTKSNDNYHIYERID
ncbi:hypothetical protein C0J52_22368 [Blattella germanica]|nr:hypothetical protein C0J52_22368 [Blattella germanica]